MDLKLVFILILSYNGWRDTVECLESLQRLNYPNYRIVVIDNGSTDGSMDRTKAWAAGELPVESKFFAYDPSIKPVRWIEYDRATTEAGGLPELEAEIEVLPPNRRMVLIQTGANLGYAGGNNVGIKYSLARGANYVWLLNNDTVMEPTAVCEMVRMMESKPQAGCVGAKLIYYDWPDTLQVAGSHFCFWSGLAFARGYRKKDTNDWNEPYMPGYLSGAALLCRRAVFEQVGFLDESFFMYAEDIDWSIRVKKANWEIWYCPQARVWHKDSATAGSKSPFMEYWMTRSNLRLVRRYHPYRLPVATFFQVLRAVRRLATGNFRRSLAVIRGIWAGIGLKL
ncbi:MAG: glycosyltransferase family 2 protein [Desulforudis sp.]|jgi:GT2 family glycosyltransferase|nr:MAG: glycosyltransferase family 2 protein [Desulforudis sp.]